MPVVYEPGLDYHETLTLPLGNEPQVWDDTPVDGQVYPSPYVRQVLEELADNANVAKNAAVAAIVAVNDEAAARAAADAAEAATRAEMDVALDDALDVLENPYVISMEFLPVDFQWAQDGASWDKDWVGWSEEADNTGVYIYDKSGTTTTKKVRAALSVPAGCTDVFQADLYHFREGPEESTTHLNWKAFLVETGTINGANARKLYLLGQQDIDSGASAVEGLQFFKAPSVMLSMPPEVLAAGGIRGGARIHVLLSWYGGPTRTKFVGFCSLIFKCTVKAVPNGTVIGVPG